MRSRRKQTQARRQFILRLFLIALLAGSLYGSYKLGRLKQETVENDLQEQVDSAKQELLEEQRQKNQLIASAENSKKQYEELKGRYEQDIPKGDLAMLMTKIQQKQKDGISSDRLALFIENAAKATSCAKIEDRRFVLPTPIYRAPNSSVSFENGLISITGMGRPETNDAGAPLAWFDGGKDIDLTFSILGKKDVKISGPLPLSHKLIIQNHEYKFVANRGRKSFLDISMQKCNLQK